MTVVRALWVRFSSEKLFSAAATGVALRLFSLLALMVITPCVENSLTVEQFGIWMALSTLLAITQFADLGIGNSLVMQISHLRGRDQDIEIPRVVTSALTVLSLMTVLYLIFTGWLETLGLPWSAYLGLGADSSSEASQPIFWFLLLLFATIPFSLGQRILYGFGEVHLANGWLALSYFLLVMFTMFFLVSGEPFFGSLVALSLSPLIAHSFCSIYELCIRKPWLLPRLNNFSAKDVKGLVSMSSGWLIYQLFFFAATSSDGLFVTNLFGAEEMSTYGLVLRLSNVSAVTILFAMPLWPLFAAQLASENYDLASKYFRYSMTVTLVVAATASLLLLFLADWFIGWWIGPHMIPSDEVVVAFAIWGFAYNMWCTVSALMANRIMMKSMVKISVLGCCISLLLKIPLADSMGSSGICLSSAIGVGVSILLGLIVLRSHIGSRFR